MEAVLPVDFNDWAEIPLAEAYRRFVLEDAEVQALSAQLAEKLTQSGKTARPLPILSIWLPVRHEDWSNGVVVLESLVERRNSDNARRLAALNKPERSAGGPRSRIRSEVDQIECALNEQILLRVKNLFDHLRAADLAAQGSEEPANHRLVRGDVPAGFWGRRSAKVFFADGLLGDHRGRSIELLYSDILVSSAEKLRRRRQGLGLPEALAEYTAHERWREIEELRRSGHEEHAIASRGATPISIERKHYRELIAQATEELKQWVRRGELAMKCWRDASSTPEWLRSDAVDLWAFDDESPFQGSGLWIEGKPIAKAVFFPTDAVPVEINALQVRDNGSQPTDLEKRPKDRRGRPQEYDWDEFVREVVRIANTPDGLPATQAELVRMMLTWCLRKWGKEPSESSVKERVRRLLPK